MEIILLIAIGTCIFSIGILISYTKKHVQFYDQKREFEKKITGLKNDLVVEKEINKDLKEKIDGLESILSLNKETNKIKDISIKNLSRESSANYDLWIRFRQELIQCEYYCRRMAEQYNIPEIQRWENLKQGQTQVVEMQDGEYVK